MENQKTILIVDDQEVGRTLLESILYKENFDLLFAVDGEEAFNQTKTEKPDLILLDVMMPKSDGYQTCQKIRADKEIQDIPIILVTALDDRDSRIRGFEAGANDYITKPIDRSELLARSKNLIKLYEYKTILNNQQNKSTIGNVPADEDALTNLQLPEKAGLPANSIFTMHARITGDGVTNKIFRYFFYQQSGKIFGLFIDPAASLQYLNMFQDALLTGQFNFNSFRQRAGNFDYLILVIDRIRHLVQCRSNRISCMVYGENKITSVFTSSTEEKQEFAPEDAVIIASQKHMEKIFESEMLSEALKNTDGSFNTSKIIEEFRLQMKSTDVDMHFFKIG
jgi:CheY-like chemotaxis protein